MQPNFSFHLRPVSLPSLSLDVSARPTYLRHYMTQHNPNTNPNTTSTPNIRK